MKTTFDLNTILFRILNVHKDELALTGAIYKDDDRPMNSEKEDISINTIDLTVDYAPQIATSNVNIHVPDKIVKLGGSDQYKKNDPRLKELTAKVIDLIKSEHVPDVGLNIEDQSLLKDVDSSHQHYSNIRISWSIHN